MQNISLALHLSLPCRTTQHSQLWPQPLALAGKAEPSPVTSTDEDFFHWASETPGMQWSGPKPTPHQSFHEDLPLEIQKHRE